MIKKALLNRMFEASVYVEEVIFCQLLDSRCRPYGDTLKEWFETGDKRFFVDEVGVPEELLDGLYYELFLAELAEKDGVIVTGCVFPCDPWDTYFDENGDFEGAFLDRPHAISAYAENLDEAFEKLIKKGEDIRRIAMNEARRLQCLPPLKES